MGHTGHMLCSLVLWLLLYGDIYVVNSEESDEGMSVISDLGDPDNNKKVESCPFVYDARVPSSQYGLINCTWYSNRACCKRTEVTAVFSDMLPLDTPSSMDEATARKCRNLINYMMCYFCDPEQARWYTTKLKICENFCMDAYRYCAQAAFGGQTIGSQFKDGVEFCESQNFEVITGQDGCFKFDPTVFSTAPHTLTSLAGLVFTLIMYLIIN